MHTSRKDVVGRRVKLVYTDDQYTKLRGGDTGTVFFVDDLGTVMVQWDDGSTLGMIPDEDLFEFID